MSEKYQPVANLVPDHYAHGQKKEASQFLQNETWESSYTLLARTVKDDLVVGKPKFNSFIKPMKAENKKLGFTGQHESTNVLDMD